MSVFLAAVYEQRAAARESSPRRSTGEDCRLLSGQCRFESCRGHQYRNKQGRIMRPSFYQRILGAPLALLVATALFLDADLARFSSV